jgi:hypothetical protein
VKILWTIAACTSLLLSGSIALADDRYSVTNADYFESSCEQQMTQERRADAVAAVVIEKMKNHHFNGASRFLRNNVLAATRMQQAAYSAFITELNSQLRARNVFGAFHWRQEADAALTPAQFRAESDLYGSRTLQASILMNVRAEAVRQGRLGDCWFLSTLSEIAAEAPWRIPAMIRVRTDGSYDVSFPGRPGQIVNVQALQPYRTADGAHRTNCGTWPLVLENAARQICPNQMTNGSPPSLALELLTGRQSIKYQLWNPKSNDYLSSEGLSELIVRASQIDAPVLASTNEQHAQGNDPGTFIENHAYSIIGFQPATLKSGAQVLIRNPHGSLPRSMISTVGLTAMNDGYFRIPIEMMHTYFQYVTVLSKKPVQAVDRAAQAQAAYVPHA